MILCLLLSLSGSLYALRVVKTKSFFGGKLIIENNLNEDSSVLVESINHELESESAWWSIVIKSQRELDLCQLLNSSCITQGMQTWLLGLHISVLNLEECELIIPNHNVHFRGSNSLKIIMPHSLNNDETAQTHLTQIKHQNSYLLRRGVKHNRILISYSFKTNDWNPDIIN